MNALNRLSIRTRLYFGTVFSLVLLVVIGAMGYLALERPRNTLEVLFTQRVQTLTDMGELRTTLGDLRRAEKDIIINFNNTIEVSNGRDLWKKSLQNLTKGMADVRKVQAADASFAEAIDKALAEVKEYEAGISPVFEQIERAQIDGAVGGAYAEKYKKHMEASDKLLFDLADGRPQENGRSPPGCGRTGLHHVWNDWRSPAAGAGRTDSAHVLQRAFHHPVDLASE